MEPTEDASDSAMVVDLGDGTGIYAAAGPASFEYKLAARSILEEKINISAVTNEVRTC